MIKTNCLNVAKNLSILLIVSLILAVLVLTPSYALTSENINFQGKIVRNDTGYEGLNVVTGTPACVVAGSSNDTCDFQVAYYTASTGGTLLLTETFTNVEIGQYQGVFELSLGSGSFTTTSQCRDGTCNTVTEVLSEYNDVYVELKFAPDGTNLTETFTRMPLEASPFSIFSKYSEGAHDAFKLSTSLSSTSQSSPTTGMIYFNTTDSQFKGYNGSSWIPLQSLWTDGGTFTYLTSTTDDLVLGASTVSDGTFYFDMDGSSGEYFAIDNASNTDRLFTILANGNVGIGTDNPTSKFQVAGASSTISNSSGDLTISTGGLNGNILLIPHGTGMVGVGTDTPSTLLHIGKAGTLGGTLGIAGSTSGLVTIQTAAVAGTWTLTLPTVDGDNGQVLTTNGSGVTSWTTIATGSSAWDAITAPTTGNLSLAHGAFTTSFSFDSVTTGIAFGLSSSSLTSGNILGISSSSTGLTGSLTDITLSGSNASNTGSLLSLNNTGTLNTNTTLLINHYATGTGNVAFRVNDVSGDTTPFVIDGGGNVGIGKITPAQPLDVTGNAVVSGNMYVDALIDKDYAGNTITFPANQRILLNGGFLVSSDSGRYTVQITGTGSNSNKTDILMTGNSFTASHASSTYKYSGISHGLTLDLQGTSGTANQDVSIFKSAITITNDLVGGKRRFTDFTTGGVDKQWIDFSGNAYFAGNIGIGVVSPSAYLHLKAGTATASTAPLKFTAGTNLTNAESGAMEWDGSRLYMTNTTPTRNTIAYLSDITAGHDALTLSAIGSTPNANAATLSGTGGQILNLQPADGTYGGVVSTTTQTFAGDKTFVGASSTTTNILSITGNSLTSGKALGISSTSTSFTGSLADISLSGSNAANTGSLLSLNNTGVLNTNTTFLINHYATGTGNLAFRVNDESGDTTPFVIDGGGNVGIGTAIPTSLLDVNGVGKFNSSIAFANGGSIGSGSLYMSINSTGTSNGNLALLAAANEEVFVGYATGNIIRFGPAGDNGAWKSDGSLGIGTTSPTAVLHLKAGTASASTAPLKFTTGVNLTTAESGAMEWDGSRLYMTNTTPTRNTIAYTSDFSGSLLPTGTEGQTLYNNAGVWTANSGVYWDDVNSRLGIGITSPSYTLDVAGSVRLGATGTDTTIYISGSGATRTIYTSGDGLLTNGNFSASGDIKTSTQIKTAVIASRDNGKAAIYIAEGSGNTFATVGIGTSAVPATYQTIISNSTSQTTLVTLGVKGIASQTGDLFRWLDSSDNVLGGVQSRGTLYSSLGTDGTNLFIGSNAGNPSALSGALGNVAVGTNSLNALTTGYGNIAVGLDSLGANTEGLQNIGVGAYALYVNTLGDNNVAVGNSALRSNLSGDRNVAIGTSSLWSNSTGYQNIAIGYGAGYSATGHDNIFIGNQAGYSETGSNKLYISDLIYGDFGTDILVINGKTGIGVASPTAVLHLKAGTAAASTAPLKFTTGVNLTTAESGAMEWDGSRLYMTNTTPTRNTIAYLSDLVGSGGSYFTDSGTITWLTSTSDDFSIGGNNTLVAPFSVDVSANTIRVGAGATSDAAMSMYASNGSTGYIKYLTSDSWGFVGGSVIIGSDESIFVPEGNLVVNANSSKSAIELKYEGNTVGEIISNHTSNIGIGYLSGKSVSTGIANTAIGSGALRNTTIGTGNTAIGYYSLLSNVAKQGSTAIGYQAMMYADSTGTAGLTYNTAIGYQALTGSSTPGNNTGTFNTAIGHQSLTGNTSGNYNNAFGVNALNGNTQGSRNIGIGYNTLFTNKVQSDNIAIGFEAMRYAYDSDTPALYYENIAIGTRALYGSTTASNNTGALNTVIGQFSMFSNTSGSSNIAFGKDTLYNNTTGLENVAIGNASLYFNVAKQGSVAIGYMAMMYADNTSSAAYSYNTAVGYEALRGSTTAGNNTGTGNTVLGYQAGYIITSGSNNTLMGVTAGSNITTGSSNILIGQGIMASSATISNELNIGNAIKGNLSTGDVNILGHLGIKGVSYTWPSSNGSGILSNNGSGVLSWSSLATLGGVTGTGSGTSTAGQITWWNGTSTITGSSGFYWDNANSRLGIGTSTPSTSLDIAGSTSEISNLSGNITITPTSNLILSQGKLGIGVTSPDALVDISGGGILRVLGTTTSPTYPTTGTGIFMGYDTDATYLNSSGGSGAGFLSANNFATSTLMPLRINVDGFGITDGAGVNRLTIDASGYSSIGGSPITSANTMLNIYGSSTLTNLAISTVDYASATILSTAVSSEGYADFTINSYWDGSTWNKRNTSYDAWGVGLNADTTSTGRIEFFQSPAGTGFTVKKPMVIGPDYIRLGTTSTETGAYDMDLIASAYNHTYGYTSLTFKPTGSASNYPNARIIVDGYGSTAVNSGIEFRTDGAVNAKITGTETASSAIYIDAYSAPADSGSSVLYRFSSSNTTRYNLKGDGTGLADVAWSTFSPYLSYNYTQDGKTKLDYKLGEVVSQKKNDRWSVTQSSSTEDTIYGVIVLAEGFVSIPKELKEGVWNGSTNLNENNYVVPVAHLGEASTMVTIKPGESINEGDPIALSSYPGVGAKAVEEGQILGRALESTTLWDTNSCTLVNSVTDITWPADDGSNPTKPCFRLPDGTLVGKIMVFVNVSWYSPANKEKAQDITASGWYRISQLNGPDDYAKLKIQNTTFGSSQNLIIGVDTVNGNNSVNVISNFTTGGYDISKARVNTVNDIKYLEIYLESVNSNTIKVNIENGDITNWISTDITKVSDETISVSEYRINGVIFGVSDTLEITKESVKVGGNLLSSSLSLNSNIGDTNNRWNDIYTKGAIRLGNGVGNEGAIRFNVDTQVLEFSNDGVTWIQLGDLTSQSVISPEYPGAILFADGSDNFGNMISDAEESTGTFKNYYEWVSDKETLQDYDILVRVTLPNDFVSWKEDAIYLDFMTENSASVNNNKVDMYLMGSSGIDAQVKDGISKLPGVWERVGISGSDISDCNNAGDTCTVRISMSSLQSYFVRVGDITLNYNRGL